MKKFSYQLRDVNQTGERHHSLGLLWQDAEPQRTGLKGSVGRYAVRALPPGRISWTKAFLTDVYLTCS